MKICQLFVFISTVYLEDNQLICFKIFFYDLFLQQKIDNMLKFVIVLAIVAASSVEVHSASAQGYSVMNTLKRYPPLSWIFKTRLNLHTSFE